MEKSRDTNGKYLEELKQARLVRIWDGTGINL